MREHRILFAALLLAFAAVLAAPPRAQASGAVSISVFHDQLAPYGRWVVAGSYGSVWAPQVAAGWAPYVDGEWIYTDYGWTWVSYDPFGDVPFHYGSWTWFDPYGWCWVPGTIWAPAWVTWAYGDDYVGWAPVPPSFGFGVTGYFGAPVVLPATRYVFVPTQQFVGVRVSSVRLPAERNSVVFARTVKTTDYRVSGGIVRTAGPPTARIERVAARKITPVSIDRVKARPTTLADAGVAKASHIRVAAPASETRRLAATSGAAAAPENRTESRSAAKGQRHPETARSTSAGHAREAAPPARAAKNEAPKKEPPKKEREHAPAETHSASGHERPPVAAEKKSHEPAPREKAKASEPSGNAASAHPRPAEPPRSEAKRAEPREETRVATHGSPPPQAHRPPPKSKPPERKPPEKKPEGGGEQRPD